MIHSLDDVIPLIQESVLEDTFDAFDEGAYETQCLYILWPSSDSKENLVSTGASVCAPYYFSPVPLSQWRETFYPFSFFPQDCRHSDEAGDEEEMMLKNFSRVLWLLQLPKMPLWLFISHARQWLRKWNSTWYLLWSIVADQVHCSSPHRSPDIHVLASVNCTSYAIRSGPNHL